MISATPFTINNPAIPPIFAGRSDEISLIIRGLFQDHTSIAIYGNEAIGKSSILLTIHQHLVSENKIFSIEIPSIILRQAIQGNFLGLITGQICTAIWTRLLNKKTSDLIEDTMLYVRDRGDYIADADEDLIRRIYRLVTNTKLEGTGTEKNAFGGKMIINAQSSHEKSMSFSRAPLSSTEFLDLIGELNDIIKGYDYDSILIVCDEMNHLPIATNTGILREYLDAFSSKKIKFLLTLSNPSSYQKEDFDLLVEAFSAPFEIGHFKKIDAVKELIDNVLSTSKNRKVDFSKSSYKTLFELTEGHPWWIQKIANDAYSEILASKRDGINSRIIEKNSQKYLAEIKLYKENMAAGRPFKKNMLHALSF
ncbi:MAG: ATP-binding protein [Pedobacter sp.]|nr:MAG: ATP-binding protein [Pedobacter sp.]